MYLVDTNIFLEYLLKRSRVAEVRDFFHELCQIPGSGKIVCPAYITII